MRRWIVRLSHLVLMLVVPLVGWSEYLDFGAKRRWFYPDSPAPSLWSDPFIVAGILFALALLGLFFATRREPWIVKGVCAVIFASFLLFKFLLLSFAATLTGSRMP